MRNVVLYLIALGGLMACTPIATTPNVGIYPTLPLAGADTCGAHAHKALLDQPVVAMEKHLILKPVRVIRPDTQVTMDFIEKRVNFYLDKNDRIVSIACG